MTFTHAIVSVAMENAPPVLPIGSVALGCQDDLWTKRLHANSLLIFLNVETRTAW